MSYINSISARQILDSRGNPTIEVDVISTNGVLGRAAVPSGASTGSHEAAELRDGDQTQYLGKSVMKAVRNVNGTINEELKGSYLLDQAGIDRALIELDGSANKSNLGANAILGVSLAASRAACEELRMPYFRYVGGMSANVLPIPLMNILNGGVHADNKMEIQEFMIMPLNATRFSDALRMGVEVFHHLRTTLRKSGYSTNVGDEGGFAPDLKSNEEAIEMILKAIDAAGYKAGEDIYLALDAAASEFYDKKKKVYKFAKSSGKAFKSDEMVAYWKGLVKKFPVVSIEDGMAEDDWEGWKLLTEELGQKVQLVGDDLFVTNAARLRQGIEKGAANSILLKVNQIGTLTEAIRASDLARDNQYTCVMSHRSGETEDSTIADLAVGLRTGQIKTGSASRSDRLAKYNQLLRIEEILGDAAIYPGKNFSYS